MNSLDFLYNSFSNIFKDGKSFSLDFIAIAICIAVGNTSFVDWDLFTWSLGCTGFFEPNLPPIIWIALLAITSLTFIFVWVPEPVCQTFKGKCSSCLPLIISSAALIINLLILGSKSLFLALTIAAAFFIIAIEWITRGLTKKSPILKYLFDLSVDAPQYLSPGTFIFPILSNSVLYFIIDSLV